MNNISLCSMSEANQNFSKVAKKLEKEGKAIILKNNKPRFLIINIEDEIMSLGLSNENIKQLVLSKCEFGGELID
ncbi:antitoxin Phd [Bacilli bacterium PM5-3]|nr:antitoxin Phd [Bacilli bacterium PM5-3]MDH6603592.1 antitoxin Phd [Bacilli bacterium PM5-9]